MGNLGILRTMAFVCATGVAGIAWAKGVPVEDATEEQWRGAQKTFLAADELFDAKRFEEAISAYRASWEIVASPNTRLQVARCLRELERVGEAYDELTAALADGERAASKDQKYARAAEAARVELSALRAQVAFVTVRVESVPDGTTFRVGTRSVKIADFARPIAVAAGKIQVVARIPGRGAVVKTVTVAPGGEGEVAFDFVDATPVTGPAPTPTPTESGPAAASDDAVERQTTSLKTYAFIAGGVGVLGLASFAVLGSINNSKFKDLEDKCTAGSCPADSQSDIDSGRQMQTFANIGLVVGVLGVGAGAALFVIDSGSERQTKVGVGPGSVTVSGRF